MGWRFCCWFVYCWCASQTNTISLLLGQLRFRRLIFVEKSWMLFARTVLLLMLWRRNGEDVDATRKTSVSLRDLCLFNVWQLVDYGGTLAESGYLWVLNVLFMWLTCDDVMFIVLIFIWCDDLCFADSSSNPLVSTIQLHFNPIHSTNLSINKLTTAATPYQEVILGEKQGITLTVLSTSTASAEAIILVCSARCRYSRVTRNVRRSWELLKNQTGLRQAGWILGMVGIDSWQPCRILSFGGNHYSTMARIMQQSTGIININIRKKTYISHYIKKVSICN